MNSAIVSKKQMFRLDTAKVIFSVVVFIMVILLLRLCCVYVVLTFNKDSQERKILYQKDILCPKQAKTAENKFPPSIIYIFIDRMARN